jgi:2-keto-3-deoxy-L-rhamnonate aldolase RhmA
LKNLLKSQLKNHKVAFGVMIGIPSPEVSYALGNLGLDWIAFDTQHTVLDTQTVSAMIQSMSYSKTVPIVRVLSNDLGLINKALDVGAQAVIIPLVNTREDTEKAVRSARYTSPGLRSWGGRASIRDPDYAATADSEIMVIPQIETELALRNIEEIVSTDGIEAIFCGPFDLSMSLHTFRKFDSPAFRKAVELIVSTCESNDVAPGLLAPIGPVDVALNYGFRVISLGGDLPILTQAIATSLENARSIRVR